MKKSKGIISLILTVVLIALLGFTTVVGFGKGQTGAAKNIKLGLDLNNRISIEIPGVTDANEILSELGQPGSLYFIKEKDSDGNPNYGLDTSGHYVLCKGYRGIERRRFRCLEWYRR